MTHHATRSIPTVIRLCALGLALAGFVFLQGCVQGSGRSSGADQTITIEEERTRGGDARDGYVD